MACKFENNDYATAKEVVLNKLGPLKLSVRESNKLAERILSENTWDQLTDAVSYDDSFLMSNKGTFTREEGVILPNVQVSKTNGTVWIRDKSGAKMYMRDKALSFLPASKKTLFSNWALNVLLGSDAKVITNKELLKLNEADALERLEDALYEEDMEDNLVTVSHVKLRDKMTHPDNLKALYRSVLDTVSQYSAKLDMDIEEVSEAIPEAGEGVDDRIKGGFEESATVDPTKRVADRLKLEFLRIPSFNANDESKRDSYFPGIPKFMNAKEVHNLLLPLLADTSEFYEIDPATNERKLVTTYEHMRRKLDSITEYYPGMKTFLDRLDKSPELQTMLVTSFSLSLMDYMSVFKNMAANEDGDKTFEAHIQRTGEKTSKNAQLQEQWANEFEDRFTKQSKNDLSGRMDLVKEAVNLYANLTTKRRNAIVTRSELIKMYKSLGLTLSEGAAKRLLKDDKSAILDLDLPMRFLKNTLNSKKTDKLILKGLLNNPINDMDNTFRTAIEAEVKYRPNFIDSSEGGKDGKQYYKFAPTGGIHKVLNALKSGDRSNLAKMKEHPMYQGSLWIDHLTDPNVDIDILIQRATAIEPIVLNLVGNETGEKADNKDLTVVDQTIAQINFAAAQFKVGHSATFLTPTPADKPRAMGFRGAPVIGEQSGDTFLFDASSEFVEFVEKGEFTPVFDKLHTVNEKVVDQFVKYYRAEEGRIAFERAAYAKHVIKVGKATTKNLEEFDEYSPEDWQAEFNRLMPVLAEDNFELIKTYHYSREYINSKVMSSTELMDATTAEDSVAIGLAMTGNASKMSMFKPIDTENGSSPSDAQVKAEMAKSLAVRYGETLKSLRRDGIIEVERGDTPGSYSITSEYIDHESPAKAIQFWLFNNMIQNIEYNKMFTADLAMYKNAVDYFKRVPATYSDGKYLALLNSTVQEVTYNVAIVNDVEAPSEYYENLRAMLKNADISKDQSWLANGYLNSLNHADGQGYITPNRWKFLMKRLNKWNDRTGELFDRMVNDPFSLTDEDLHDVNALMKPLKGVASGIDTSNNTPSQRYIKYSQAVIIPAFAKGTAMEEVLHMMEPHGFNPDGTYNTNKEYSEKEHKETTHELIFESGIKIGASNITDIHYIPDASKPHEFAINPDSTLEPTPYRNADWKLQQDLPDNMIHPTLLASQIQANIKANIRLDLDYEIPGLGKITGTEILAKLDEIITNMSDAGAAKLKRKFGLNENFEITNTGSFYNALLLQVKDKASSREKEALETGFNLNALPSIGGTGVTILMSMVAKAAVKLKTNGGSFVQVSGVFSNLTGENKRQILTFTGNSIDKLKPPRKYKSGNTQRGQAFLGYSAVAKYFPMKKGETFEAYGVRFREELKSGRLPKEIFSVGIGYRIPNQNMSSNDSLEIVGILPPTMGDSIVLYDEIVTKTGSDFDIDKMYMMVPSVKTHIKGNYQLLQSDLNEFGVDDATSARMYVATMLGDEGGEQMINDILGAELGKDKFGIGEATWKRDLSSLVLGIYNYDKSQLDDTLVEVLEQKGVIDKYSVPNALKEGKENIGAEANANALISIYRGILESKHTAADVVSPLDFDWLKDFVGALGLNTTPNLADNLLFTDPLFQSNLKASFKAGKLGVAQSANHVSHHPLAQEANLATKTPISVLHGTRTTADGVKTGLQTLDREWEISMDPSGEFKSFDFLTKTDRSGVSAPVEVKRLKITQILSSFLNAYVDIAKDPYVTAGNFNQSTFNVAAIMMRAGMQKEVVLAFIASTPIKQLTQGGTTRNVLGPNFESFGEKFDFDDFVGKNDIVDFDPKILSENLIWDDAGDVYLTPTQMMIYAKNGTLNRDESLRHGTKDTYLDMDSVERKYVDTFKYVRFMAGDLGKTMRAHKLSNGVGTTIAEKVIKQNEMDESLDQGVSTLDVESVGRLRKRNGLPTSINAQWVNTMEFMPHLHNFMIQFDPRFDAFLNEASLYFNNRMLSIKDKDFGTLVEKQGVASLFSHKDFGLQTEDYVTELFGKGNDALPNRVLQAQRSQWGKDNDFLQNLTLNTRDKKLTFINFAKLSDNDPNTKDHYMEQFEEIKAIDPQLYKDLLSYNMYASGVSPTRSSFTQYIPTSVAYEGKYDEHFAKAKSRLHYRLNNDTVREIALNNVNALIPTLKGSEEGLAPGSVKSHRYSLVANSKDKGTIGFKQALKLVADGAYDLDSRRWVEIMNLTLPGSTMTHGSRAALSETDFPPILSYHGNKSKQQAFIKHKTKKGDNVIYEFMGSYISGTFTNDVYVLAEQLGYSPKTGGRMLEYGVSESAIDSNNYKNYTKGGESDSGLLRLEMENFKNAVRFALSADSEATADDADEFMENC